MDTSQLFTTPPDFVAVFTTVFKIFGAHWTQLLLLALVEIIVFGIVLLLLELITFGFLVTYMTAIMASMSKASDALGGNGRHLIDYAFFSGTSRFLQQNDDDDFGVDDLSELMDAKFFIIVPVVYVMWIVVLSLVSSLFSGAFVHAIADIYAGNSPSINRSISYAKTRMWSIYCFHLLCILAISGLLFVSIGIPVLVNVPDFELIGLIVIGIIVGFIASILFATAMVAGIPSIVIEGKSSSKAFGRSWELCKNYLGSIFCTLFCMKLFMLVAGSLANSIFDQLPGFFVIAGHLLVLLINMVITPIINFVIYMSVRVQSEYTTQEDIILAIGTDTINGVEMAEAIDVKAEAPEGSYKQVVTAEVI